MGGRSRKVNASACGTTSAPTSKTGTIKVFNDDGNWYAGLRQQNIHSLLLDLVLQSPHSLFQQINLVTFAPCISGPIMLNNASRTLSVIGRVVSPGTERILIPRALPPIILSSFTAHSSG